MTSTSERLPAQPTLYQRSPDGATLQLRMLRNPATGRLTFPANAYGAADTGLAPEACETVLTDGTGRLLNFVTVWQALAPGLVPPVVIGEVALAAGVVEEAVMGVTDESALAVGMAVQAVACDDPERPDRYGCRFVPAAEAAR